MPLDFPNSPTTGDIFNGAGVSWRWDGMKWTSVLATGGPFLPLSGGTVTGVTQFQSDVAVWETLYCAPVHMTASFDGATHNFGSTKGFYQELDITGSFSSGYIQSINQWTVPWDNLAMTGQILFHSGIFYNFGGGGFTGNRGGLIIDMHQSGAVSGSANAGGIEVLHASATTTGTFGGTNPGPGAAGAVFAGNFDTIMQAGSQNLLGTCGIEIDVEANTGAVYQGATGLAVVSTVGHTQAPIVTTSAVAIAGQSGSIGFTHGISFSNWGMRAGSTLIQTDWAADTTTFPVTRGIDFRPITFSSDAFSAAGTSITSTGAVRIGTGYINATATGASIHVDGAICTSGTLTASVTTMYANDGNQAWVDDPYGGIWSVTFSGTTISAITQVVAGYVQGSPPANPITLTPRGRLKIFAPGTITANLTWDTSRHGLTLQGSGGPLILSNLPTSAAGLIAGQVWRNGTVLNVV